MNRGAAGPDDDAELGVDLFSLAGGGVTPNGPLDADAEGGNHLQKFPVLRSASTVGSGVLVVGRLLSASLQAYAVDFFASPERDPSGFGEGERFRGSVQVTTDSLGSAAVQANFAASVPGEGS